MKEKKLKVSRKERERLMIEEMEAAVWEQKNPNAEQPKTESGEGAEIPSKQAEAKGQEKTVPAQKKTEQKIHCSRCRSLMENGKCPTCGHYIYVPMDEKKRKKIRLIVGGVCVVVFAILFVLLQAK